MAVYYIKDSVSTCKHWRGPVGTCVQENAGGYTQNSAYLCLIFGWEDLYWNEENFLLILKTKIQVDIFKNFCNLVIFTCIYMYVNII